MGLTRVDLLPRVRQRLAANANDALLTQDSLYQSINNGLANLAAERDWYWLDDTSTITTVAGTNTYDLPVMTHMHTVSINGSELDLVQYRSLLQQTQSATGRPTNYSFIRNQIVVAPTPSQEYTIDLYFQAPENGLVIDDDEMLCPDYYADVVVTYAAIDAAIRIRDQALLVMLQQLAQQQLTRIEQEVWRGDVGPQIVTRSDNRLGGSW